ncbi:MAG: DMT family transporter [Syntrophales bacterium]|nr:DMT family transporter [Syntrophales bacterium]
MSRDEIIGTISLIAGVGLFSTVEVASKFIGKSVDPLVLTFIRFFVTGILLLCISVPTLRLRVRLFNVTDIGIFLLNGFIGVTLSISLFHMGVLVLEKAASAAVVFSVNPVFVIVLARYINGEAWSPRKWIAVVLGVAGVICFACESGSVTDRSVGGLAIMSLSAFFFAVSVCISRRVMARYGAMILMGFSALFGSLMLFPFACMRLSAESITAMGNLWLPILYLSIVGTAMAYAFYYFGLLSTSAQKAGMVFFLKPVLASILAALLLGESFNVYMIGGTLLILTGLALVLMKPNRILQ